MPLSKEHVAAIKAELTMIETHEPGISLRLVLNSPDTVAAFNKSYGFFRNAANYIVAIADKDYSDTVERAGYFAEQTVLAVTELSLGTCFVGGTFSRDKIDTPLRVGQEILFIVLIGYPDHIEPPRPLARMAMKIAHMKKMSPEDFFITRGKYDLPTACKMFPFLKTGLEAIAAAPSSLNKRPVRVWIGTKDDREVVRIGIPEITTRQYIDLGIAKCNFAKACDGYWDWGNGAAFYPDEQ